MCTASWSSGSGGATLIFNRDERKDRPRAELPNVLAFDDGIGRLAPIDVKAGGTWLAINEFGVCSFLLNNYEAGSGYDFEGVAMSRGRLPILATGASSLEAASDLLEEYDFSEYRPFFLGILSAHGCRIYSWTGKAFSRHEPEMGFLTTSSYRSQDVQDYREKRFREEIHSRGELSIECRKSFHLEPAHGDTAFNPLMLREESETHNVSIVRIDHSGVGIEYIEKERDGLELSPANFATLPIVKK